MRTLERLIRPQATLTLGCSTVLGIGDLPLTDGGIDASSTSAATRQRQLERSGEQRRGRDRQRQRRFERSRDEQRQVS